LERRTIVVTSISAPNAVMKTIADKCCEFGYDFLVIGDTKSPAVFSLSGCRYFSVDEQLATGLQFAQLCPTRHYARKNIGYLIAIRDGADIIQETDDDNFPRDEFFGPRDRSQSAITLHDRGWVNIYRYFTDQLIWPRGLPLDAVHDTPVPVGEEMSDVVICPIQQGLADENPDVDAVYRLILPLPVCFAQTKNYALAGNSWCPFNSQNTMWWTEAFPLLYLPAYCSFRMTDIWRSFVAQRIARENGWSVLFHNATVRQERNEHNLMTDFMDEVPGYQHNRKIAETLDALVLKPGQSNIPEDMRQCYQAMVELGVVGDQELALLDAWLQDLETMGRKK